MFELTGQITYILPTMVCVTYRFFNYLCQISPVHLHTRTSTQITLLVTKAVGDWFGKGGIADRYIQLNGYPFLDKEEHTFGVPGKGPKTGHSIDESCMLSVREIL